MRLIEKYSSDISVLLIVLICDWSRLYNGFLMNINKMMNLNLRLIYYLQRIPIVSSLIFRLNTWVCNSRLVRLKLQLIIQHAEW